MPLPRLSPRLSLLLSLCKSHEPLWDIFCDHGYLGQHAGRQARFSEIHFVDKVPAIISSLRQRCREDGWEVQTETGGVGFHAADALDLDWLRVTGNVVLAGVGGALITRVLERVADPVPSSEVPPRAPTRRLILCPNDHFDKMKHNALARGFGRLGQSEHAISERGRLRQILVVDD